MLCSSGLKNNLGPERPSEGFALGQHLDELMTYANRVKMFKILTLEDGEGPSTTDLAEQLENRKNNPAEAAKFLLEYLLVHLRAAGH
jgi:hypothetical protein